MRIARFPRDPPEFDVLLSTRTSQAAIMVLAPGESTGDLENEHPHSEQWLFVLSGSGTVRVPKRSVRVHRHDLVLIEKAERHQVRNHGRKPFVSLNIYAPLAYTKNGEPKGENRNGRKRSSSKK